MLFFLTDLQTSNYYSFIKFSILFLISFISNIFSSISGGGAGLIQLPSLLLLGLPYIEALSIHKSATVALGLGGTLRNWKLLGDYYYVSLQILIFGIPGVLLGAKLVGYLSEEYLYLLLGIFSILLVIWVDG